MEVLSKPNWVPLWVWDEFQGCQDPMADPIYQSAVDTFSKMINSREMVRVWKSLEARDAQIGRFPKAATLASVVEATLDEFGGSERMTGAARKKLAQRMDSCAEELNECMKLLNNGAGYTPDLLSDRIGVRFDRIISALQIQYSYKAIPRLKEQHGERGADICDGVLLGIELYDRMPSLVSAIADGAREWASAPVVVGQPKNENAARLYFIRELTGKFRYWYGNPLRANTLAVASVFFDCSGLSEAAITKLAP